MKSLRLHCLQHVAFEGPGCIEHWVLEKGYKLSSTKFFENETLPEHSDYDLLIIMGGPMGVYDEKKYPWLIAEKEFINQAIQNNKKILGICLGAQLIASALRADVYPNKEKEIGWFTINVSETLINPLFKEENSYTVFHWHGDTFDLPKAAVNLAKSEGCFNQAFSYNDKVLGLQFHLEVTEDSLQQMVTFGVSELTQAKYIQTAKEILNEKELIIDNNQRMFQLLNYLEQE
jgi:GMP synthase-like glutamine amidotransferase